MSPYSPGSVQTLRFTWSVLSPTNARHCNLVIVIQFSFRSLYAEIRLGRQINNVGRGELGGLAEPSEEDWDQQLHVNFETVYLFCHVVLPIMEKWDTGSSIIHVPSVAGLRYMGKPQAAYSSAKAGIVGFPKITAVIYAEKGVRLNVIGPGLIERHL